MPAPFVSGFIGQPALHLRYTVQMSRGSRLARTVLSASRCYTSAASIVRYTEPRIAILGGGLGGLATQLHLHRLGLQSTVYEREDGLNARAHIGGMLDMHHSSGKRCLEAGQLPWKKHVNQGGDAMKLEKIYTSKGELLHEEHGSDVDTAHLELARPEIDRSTLRKLLYDGCPSSSIKWSKGVSSIEPQGDGFVIHFQDGSTEPADVLIGADGANSRVRNLVSPESTYFVGYHGAEVSLSPEAIKDPSLAETITRVTPGSSFCVEKDRGIFCQQQGTGRVRAYCMFVSDDPDFPLPTHDVEASRAVLLEKFDGFAPWLLDIIRHCDPSAIYARPFYVLPLRHYDTWTPRKGVTLVGDAGHLMEPSGEGANLALLDGLELAEALAEAKEDAGGAQDWWNAGIRKYEEAMLPRSREAAEDAPTVWKLFLGEREGLDKAIVMFSGADQAAPPVPQT